MATKNELVSAGRMTGDALAGVVGAVAHVHRSIADRTFTAMGPAGEPARALNDVIARGAYAAVRAGHAFAPRLGAAIAVVAGKGDDQSSWNSSPRSSGWLSALNGLRGDDIAKRYPELAVTMSLRDQSGAGDLPMRADAIKSAIPDAGGKLVIFVHGLCESDRSWRRRAEAQHGDPTITYGSLLETDLGWAPVYLRYNTGLRVEDNGRLLGALMTELVDAWPVPVHEVAFVAHSMGGLVVRQACHDADLAGHAWTTSVRHVVCLGTPHLGAPLARGVDRLVPTLSRIGVTQPLARFLDDRSDGIRDLEHGLGTDTDVPFLRHADWSFIGATVTRDRRHPVGYLLGDLLVRYRSATGDVRVERSSFDLANVEHIGGIDHFDLLNHPAVYAQIAHRLGRTPAISRPSRLA